MFLGSKNLTHILNTIPSTGPVDVISCNDRFFLERMHGVQTVRDNWKVWQYLLEATCNTDIEEKLAACNSVHEALGVVTEWTLPASEAEKDAGDAGNGDGGTGGHRGGGLLSCTFGGATRGDEMGSDRHCFTLQFALNTAPPLRHLSSLFPHAPPGSSIWVGDSGSSVHGTGSDQFVYNKRLPRSEETYLHIGNGYKLKVEWLGSLDVVLHCKEDVPVTLEDVAVVPSLAFDLMSINCIQKRYDILMNREGAWLLNSRVHFVKSPTGNYIAATRVKYGSADPPAMVAAMMRPGPQRSMNCDDLDFSLGHTNDDNARETAKQRGIKVTGVRGYCDGCGESKAIRRAVPKETTLKAERPLKRVFVDLAGPFLTSAGGARYCMLMVDDYTNVGWTLFLGNKSGDTLCQAFRSWHTAVKSTAAIHGGLEIARFDNGNEFTNADFRKLLTELGVAVEYTSIDGAKRSDRVERKLALIAEGARAAWLEFPVTSRTWSFLRRRTRGIRSGPRRSRG